jgi:hypothetical protein
MTLKVFFIVEIFCALLSLPSYLLLPLIPPPACLLLGENRGEEQSDPHKAVSKL